MVDAGDHNDQFAGLEFLGRQGDSLYFKVNNARKSDVSPPVGFGPDSIIGDAADDVNIGFRFDIVDDSAVLLPDVPANLNGNAVAGDVDSMLYAFHEPGVSLFPNTLYPTALTVAAQLRSNCQFESALSWYNIAYRPLSSNNAWVDNDSDPNEDDPLNHEDSECKCGTTKASDEQALRRTVLLEYLETLLDWGNSLLKLSLIHI